MSIDCKVPTYLLFKTTIAMYKSDAFANMGCAGPQGAVRSHPLGGGAGVNSHAANPNATTTKPKIASLNSLSRQPRTKPPLCDQDLHIETVSPTTMISGKVG